MTDYFVKGKKADYLWIKMLGDCFWETDLSDRK